MEFLQHIGLAWGLGLTLGAAASAGLLMGSHRRQRRFAQNEASQLIDTAQREADTMRHLARQEGLSRREQRLASEAGDLERAGLSLAEHDNDVQQREAALNKRQDQQLLWEATVAEREHELSSLNTKLHNYQRELPALREAVTPTLAKRAELSPTATLAQLVEEQVSRHQLIVQMEARKSEANAQDVNAIEARRLMSLAIDRYDGVAHLERIQNAIVVPDVPMFKALSDTENSVYRAFVETVGCDLQADENTQTLFVRGDDPLAREIGRRVLRQVSLRPLANADALHKLMRQIQSEVDGEVQNAGRRAFHILDLGRVHPEILTLVGRLKYRLSYSQNQWKHAIEVGFLAGLLAREMGLDEMLARRGGLLHDIGKAMTHDREGSHAVLGAEVARRCGENEIVANAIGSHHNDEVAATAIANIVTAADAISGARPGARREAVTQYMDRIEAIYAIASQSPAVKRVDIMQAGREVRVIVGGDVQGELDESEHAETSSLSDAELHPLACEIARTIEENVTFAGQIRVTIVRESRAIAVAH